ncbi:hypothetical protein [Sorangium sp. So ce693]|uniref:hypothetical protein n=1 Tax=Sorangium sp. So ce693 TaxID=3133318 RepID=UPI003F61EA61
MPKGPLIHAVAPAPSVAPIDAALAIGRTRARAVATAPRLGVWMLDVRPRRGAAVAMGGFEGIAAVFKLPTLQGERPAPQGISAAGPAPIARGPEPQGISAAAAPALVFGGHGLEPQGILAAAAPASSPAVTTGELERSPTVATGGLERSPAVATGELDRLPTVATGGLERSPAVAAGELDGLPAVTMVEPLRSPRIPAVFELAGPDAVPARSPLPQRGGALEGSAVMPFLHSRRMAMASMRSAAGVWGPIVSPLLPAASSLSRWVVPNVSGPNLSTSPDRRRAAPYTPLADHGAAGPPRGALDPLDSVPEGGDSPMDGARGSSTVDVDLPDIDVPSPARDAAPPTEAPIEGPALVHRRAPARSLPARGLDGLAGPLIDLVRREVSEEVARAAEHKPPPPPPPPPANRVDVESDDFVRGLMNRMASIARDEQFRSGRLR